MDRVHQADQIWDRHHCHYPCRDGYLSPVAPRQQREKRTTTNGFKTLGDLQRGQTVVSWRATVGGAARVMTQAPRTTTPRAASPARSVGLNAGDQRDRLACTRCGAEHSSDHSAKAPKRREMQAAPTAARAGRDLGLPVGNTKPAVCSPATETSASPPGAMTGSGNNRSAVARTPASHQAAIRKAVRSQVNRDRADGARWSLSIGVDASLCLPISSPKLRGPN